MNGAPHFSPPASAIECAERIQAALDILSGVNIEIALNGKEAGELAMNARSQIAATAVCLDLERRAYAAMN